VDYSWIFLIVVISLILGVLTYGHFQAVSKKPITPPEAVIEAPAEVIEEEVLPIIEEPSAGALVKLVEVRGSMGTNCVTVTYDRQGTRKKCQIHIPEHLPERHLADQPLHIILSEIPQEWVDYLLELPEAEF
jgi:hypothetical protein